MEIGIQCLLAGEANATELASQLEDINDQRKALERSMQEEALDSLSDADIEHRMSSCSATRTGIRACRPRRERVKERTHRPVIAFAPTKNGLLRGSGRSIPGLHLRYCLSRIDTMFPGLILRYGGHALAAGLTIRGDGLEQFRDAFEKVVSENISPELLTEDIVVDGALAPEEISFGLIREIDSVVWGSPSRRRFSRTNSISSPDPASGRRASQSDRVDRGSAFRRHFLPPQHAASGTREARLSAGRE